MYIAVMRKTILIASAVVMTAIVVLAQNVSTFTDKRNGKTYRTVKIDKQVWMAQNLNYDVPNVTTDVCYGNNADNCAKYGRLYNWSTAKTACPAGWHLPSDAEWTTLTDFVGGKDVAGKKLKATAGWNEDGNGTDEFGFSALPGGYGKSGGSFRYAGFDGYWWSATEGDADRAWYRCMGYGNEGVRRINYVKTNLFSVRCVQD